MRKSEERRRKCCLCDRERKALQTEREREKRLGKLQLLEKQRKRERSKAIEEDFCGCRRTGV